MKIILTTFLSIFILNANNLEQTITSIFDIQGNTARINISNLQKGQSGVIVHNFKNGNSAILADAIVSKSNDKFSQLKIVSNTSMIQKALPSTNLEPAKGDTFILNHLYRNSLLITPNYSADKIIKSVYFSNNFFSSDLFAAYLKIDESPVPTQKLIQAFAQENNIGTIYIYINDTLYILDSISFQIISQKAIKISSKEVTYPFYTNIREIKKSTFDFFGEDGITNYNKYYAELLGI